MATESDKMFASLSTLDNLHVLVARTAEDLLLQIQEIRKPARVLAIYHDGARHTAWVQGNFKIKKVTKEKEKTNGSIK